MSSKQFFLIVWMLVFAVETGAQERLRVALGSISLQSGLVPIGLAAGSERLEREPSRGLIAHMRRYLLLSGTEVV